MYYYSSPAIGADGTVHIGSCDDVSGSPCFARPLPLQLHTLTLTHTQGTMDTKSRIAPGGHSEGDEE